VKFLGRAPLKRHGLGPGLLAISILFPVLPASAQKSRPLAVEEMSGTADVIGVATVRSIASRLESRTGMICTDYTLSFSEVWKGEAGPEFLLVRMGGRLGQDSVTLPGFEFDLRTGEELVVFAYPSKLGNHVTVGLHQGLYRVGQGPDRPLFRVSEFPLSAGQTSTLTLQGLKDQVWRALGRPTEQLRVRPLAPPVAPAMEKVDRGSAGNAAAPELPSESGAVPASPAGGGLRSWAGLLALGLVLGVGAGVVIFRRRTGVKP